MKPRQQHGALHLRARDLGVVVQRRAAPLRPRTVSGGRPSRDSMRAPIRSSGTITRRMGRPCSEASPDHASRQTGAPPGSPPACASCCRNCRRPARSAGATRPPSPRPVNPQVPSGCIARQLVDRHTQLPQTGERRSAIAAGGVAGDSRRAVGQRGQQRVPVGHRTCRPEGAHGRASRWRDVPPRFALEASSNYNRWGSVGAHRADRSSGTRDREGEAMRRALVGILFAAAWSAAATPGFRPARVSVLRAIRRCRRPRRHRR